ncbi:MAG TPA: cysteine desulfurase family protein [Acidimicrobiia bacterium]|nr:cysteine desulfurase family protein [Acidimicrobiia bacterium]
MPYLDHAASTPLRPEAFEAMLPFLQGSYGNPSGQHAQARAAKTAIEEAREQVAAAVGAKPAEIVFTGGGTEADNLAIKGAARSARDRGFGDGVVTTAVEHHAVLHSCDRLGRDGFRVTKVGVDRDGVVDVDALAAAVDDRTTVVSVMLANNEVGTVQPLAAVAAVVGERAPRAVLHTDAVQAAAWLDVAETAVAAELIAISAHKFGGPKGVGALVVRQGAKLVPVIDGGGQERDLRSGTHNVAGIVGMAAALTATVAHRAEETRRVAALRDRLAAGIAAGLADGAVRTNGDPARKLVNNCHLAFPGVEAEALLLLLDRDGVCASAGSSCASGALEPSHVLAAMGLPVDLARSSVRLTLGWTTTEAEVDEAIGVITAGVERLGGRAAARRVPARG